MGIENISDDELIRRCRYRWYEAWIMDSPGCGFVIAMAVVLSIVVVAILFHQQNVSFTQDPWWVVLGYLVLIGLAGLITLPLSLLLIGLPLVMILTARPNRYHRHVLMRFGPPLTEHLIIKMEKVLAEPTCPAWMLALSGGGLPRGDSMAVWVKGASSQDSLASIEVWTCPHVDIAETDPRPLIRHVKCDLTVEETEQMNAHVLALRNQPLEDVPQRVIDGFPCEVMAVSRGDKAIQSAECNLSFPDRAEATTQEEQIGLSLLDLAEKYAPEEKPLAVSD